MPRSSSAVVRAMAFATAAWITACFGAGPASAAPTVPYVLGKGSTFEYGCFDPCLCPIFVTERIAGDFSLERVGSDGLFDQYLVSDVNWKAEVGDRVVPVTGAGTYRIGGEFALQHQLTLDLEVDGMPARRFDSGLQAGGSEFPAIRIDIALHGFFCLDTAFSVNASPATAGIGDGNRLGITRVSPNPSGAEAVVEYSLPRHARVDLIVYDTAGRRVRGLLEGTWRTAGAHRAAWDGRRDDGTTAPAGLYFVGVSAEGRQAMRRVVRL